MTPRGVLRFALMATTAHGTTSCKPEFEERESLVDRVRVLAVRVEPAEAKPGERVTTTLLVATPTGRDSAPHAAWALCATPKSINDNGAVSAACATTGVIPVVDDSPSASAVVPTTSCFDFGPETQSADVRPRDADVTGGYYLPIRARLRGAAGAVAFGFARLACNLTRAPADVVVQYARDARRNTHPVLLPLEVRVDRNSEALGQNTRVTVDPGTRVVLRAAWPPESAETYVLFDVKSQTLTTRRESLRVSWYATAGAFEQDRSGRNEEEFETYTDNVWAAPTESRLTHVFTVLRDARGGIAFTTLEIATR